jgi:hypothetical protein
MSLKGFLPYKGRELMEKHKAPTQLPTNVPSLELQIFKKSIGGTLGGQLGPWLCFPSTLPPSRGCTLGGNLNLSRVGNRSFRGLGAAQTPKMIDFRSLKISKLYIHPNCSLPPSGGRGGQRSHLDRDPEHVSKAGYRPRAKQSDRRANRALSTAGYLKAVRPEFWGCIFEGFPGPPGPARLQKRTQKIRQDCLQVPSYFMLPNIASGPKIGLQGRISAGF